MPRRRTATRLERLDELTALLRAGTPATASGLAAALRVSQRTLTRDVRLLRERGMPIEADVGRGGGMRLHRHWSVGRVNLDYREAIDVLLCLAVVDKLGSALFLRQLKAIRNKLSLTFAAAQRERIALLRRRILVGAPASASVLASYAPAPAAGAALVHEAFFEMRRIEITYVDQQSRRSVRRIEPQFLYLAWPVWYLLAWDELRGDVRSFRIDRVQRAVLEPGTFALRDPRRFLAAIEGSGETL